MVNPDEAKLLVALLEGGAIPALSIKQPYPHHIFHDGKDVENRDWPTRYRGWFVVHAGVSTSEINKSQADLPRGGCVGFARITDCVDNMDSQWFFGKHGFVLVNAFPIELVPCRGKLGFFKLPPEVYQELAVKAREALRIGKYRSPIPVEMVEDYRTRPGHVRGSTARIHTFPQADGRKQWCDPRLCRECYREQHWKEGQTHG